MSPGQRRRVVGAAATATVLVLVSAGYAIDELSVVQGSGADAVRVVPAFGLPAPLTDGDMSVESALQRRRSTREFAPDPLTLGQLGQLLWAAQGESDDGRNAPSAGALYPLEIYVAHDGGVFHYRPADHEVVSTGDVDIRRDLALAALGQRAFDTAPAVIAIAGVNERMAVKYGSRAERYVLIEAGHAGQNILLQAVAIGVGAVPTGAFRDDPVAELFGMPAGTAALYLIPVGMPA